MPYMLLIHEEVGQRRQRTDAEGHAVYDRMVRFAGSLKKRGVLRAVESLTSQNDSSRVTVRSGKAHVIDGPFAEAKEMVGGFFPHRCRHARGGAGHCARMPRRGVGDRRSARDRALLYVARYVIAPVDPGGPCSS